MSDEVFRILLSRPAAGLTDPFVPADAKFASAAATIPDGISWQKIPLGEHVPLFTIRFLRIEVGPVQHEYQT